MHLLYDVCQIIYVSLEYSPLPHYHHQKHTNWMKTYYKRAFSAETSLYSVLNAIFVSTGGMASSYLGGALSDR